MGKMSILIVLLSVTVVFCLNFINSANAQSSSTVRTRVGNPPVSDGGWPTTGVITQGPLGALDHGRIFSQTGAESLDIANQSAPPVYSSFDGTVSAIHDCTADGDCSRGWGGYGNSVEVRGDIGGTVLYGHFSVITVSLGQKVKKGDQLGIMGTTGVSTGIHLHWEFRGIKMAPPNIPDSIIPANCDPEAGIACSPISI